MKTLITIIALAVCVQAQSAKEGKGITNWTLVATGQEQSRSYFAPETIQRGDDHIRLWTRWDLVGTTLPMLPGVASARVYATLDCEGGRSQALTAIFYDSEGRVIKAMEHLKNEWATETPNTIGHAIFAYFCEREATAPVSAPKLKP